MQLEQWKAAAQATTMTPRLATQEPWADGKATEGGKQPVGVRKGVRKGAGQFELRDGAGAVGATDDKNGVLFGAFWCEKERETGIFPGRKKVSCSKPTEKYPVFIMTPKERRFLRHPTWFAAWPHPQYAHHALTTLVPLKKCDLWALIPLKKCNFPGRSITLRLPEDFFDAYKS